MAATKNPQAKSNPQEYVLPMPPRPHGAMIVAGNGAESWQQFALEREAGALRRIGSRLQTLIECQDRFLAELRTTLIELDSEVHEESRARIKSQVRELLEILDWSGAVQKDLAHEGELAANGVQPLDVAELVQGVIEEYEAGNAAVQITVVGHCRSPWWGRGRELVVALQLALAIVQERVGGAGSLAFEMSELPGVCRLRIYGLGEPKPLETMDLVDRFRSAVKAIGGLVVPDELGVGGAGIVLTLPMTGTGTVAI